MNIQLRPSLTPVQQKQKQSLEDFIWGHYRKDRAGHMPVGIRYMHDGSPYLWHFERRLKVDPTLTTRGCTDSVVSTESHHSSVADHELVRCDSQETPTLEHCSSVPQVSPLSQSPVVLELFPSSSMAALPLPVSDAVSPLPQTEPLALAAMGEIVGVELSSSAGPTASTSQMNQHLTQTDEPADHE